MKVKFQAILHKFREKGEKSSWTFIEVEPTLAVKLNPGNRKSFRVKGTIDALPLEQAALLPMGDGSYILPVNTPMRKALKKKEGDEVFVVFEPDAGEFKWNEEMMACLEGEPTALKKFKAMPLSHQKYFSKWVDSARTTATRAERIARTLFAMNHSMDYGTMIRYFSGKR